MMCEQCGVRQATVHVTRIENNKKLEARLCQECAQSFSGFVPGIDFQNLLATLFEQPKVWGESTALPAARCEVCHLSLADIRKLGQLGCSHCYQTFNKEITSLLKRIHGTPRHTGKIPATGHAKTRLQRNIEELRFKLEEAIKSERYEDAAKYRDDIHRLQKALQTYEEGVNHK